MINGEHDNFTFSRSMTQNFAHPSCCFTNCRKLKCTAMSFLWQDNIHTKFRKNQAAGSRIETWRHQDGSPIFLCEKKSWPKHGHLFIQLRRNSALSMKTSLFDLTTSAGRTDSRVRCVLIPEAKTHSRKQTHVRFTRIGDSVTVIISFLANCQ
jgi:hypothetical protein